MDRSQLGCGDPRIDAFLKAFGIRPDAFFAKPGQIAEGVFTFGSATLQPVVVTPAGGGTAFDMDAPVQVDEEGTGNYYLFGRASRFIASQDPTATADGRNTLGILAGLFATVPTVGGTRSQIHPAGSGIRFFDTYRNITLSAGGQFDGSVDFGWHMPAEGFVLDNERPVVAECSNALNSGDDIFALWQVQGVAIAKSLLPNDPPIPEINAWCQCKYNIPKK